MDKLYLPKSKNRQSERKMRPINAFRPNFTGGSRRRKGEEIWPGRVYIKIIKGI
jgi:hypothetical protein